MTVLDLYRQGYVRLMYETGLLSPSIMLYFRYYEKVDYLRNRANKSYNEAILITSLEFGVSESTVKRAVRIITGSNLMNLKQN